ncbi:E3 ubiquitin-protein ligase TRIM36-like, partial [Saccostrea cucullata]|uniref:E3 ubiquitin-protein ligase TRIM36-like n=1 Tax=Saccostrea cuccullata TaxID=36930 RepID=UPI002ED2DD16
HTASNDDPTNALDLIRCDLCETAVAQMHCDTCLVNLCKACVGKHTKYDKSKDHKFVKFQFWKSTPLYPGCESHSKQQCTMYCNLCDIPVCTKCLASDQHLGHKLSEILQVVGEKKSKIIKDQIEFKETIYPTYQNIASDKHPDEINKNLSEIKDEIDSAEMALDTHDMSKLFAVKSNLDRYKKLPQKVVPSNLKFLPGKIQRKELSNLFGTLLSSSLTSDKHGYSMKTTQKSSEAGSPSPVKQLLNEPETVTTIDTGYSELYSVACLSDEGIWTSGDDNTMKLFSIDQGSLLKSITTKSGDWPEDIAVTKSGNLVYSDISDETVNIAKNEKIEEVIKLQNWGPDGVCSTSSGDLLVIMISDDNKLNLNICVSDSRAKSVVVVNQAGKLRFGYTGHTPAPKNKPFYPLGITTDSQCHILTADPKMTA